MKLDWIKDSIGQDYIGVKIPNNLTIPYLEQMQKILGEEFEKYKENQKSRDSGEYHITVINAPEVSKLIKELGVDDFLNQINSDNLKINFKGLGKATKGGSTAFFIVCKSTELDSIRKKLSLQEKDFHVTLGFNPRDVFGVRKNKVLNLKSDLLEKIIKGLEKSGDLSILESELGLNSVKPISISDNKNYIKVSSNNIVMDIGLDDSGKFKIYTEYNLTNESELTLTEFLKLINSL